MENNKVLSLEKNIFMGLTWLFFPLGIVGLCVDNAKMDKKYKQDVIQVFVTTVACAVVCMVLGIIHAIISGIMGAAGAPVDAFSAVGLVFTLCYSVVWVLPLVLMIMGFCNKFVELPVMWNIAGNFVKDKAETPKAEEAPKAEEEKTEE